MNTFGGFAVSNGAYRVPIGASPFLMLMNKDLWESLSPEVQEVMMRHGGEALARRGGQAYDEITVGIVEERRAAGYVIEEASAEEIAAYQDTYAGIYDRWISETENGAEVLDTFRGLIDAYRAE